MSRALENDASIPGRLVVASAEGMRAIGVGSSRRNIPKSPPRFFSACASAAGAVHCSAAAGFAGAAGASGAVVERGHASVPSADSGGVPGAQVFAGVSLAAGGAVIHESAGRDGAGVPCAQVSVGCGCGAGGSEAGTSAGALAAGPGAKMPVSVERRSSTAGGTSGRRGSGVVVKLPKRSAICASRSSRVSAGEGGGARCSRGGSDVLAD